MGTGETETDCLHDYFTTILGLFQPVHYLGEGHLVPLTNGQLPCLFGHGSAIIFP